MGISVPSYVLKRSFSRYLKDHALNVEAVECFSETKRLQAMYNPLRLPGRVNLKVSIKELQNGENQRTSVARVEMVRFGNSSPRVGVWANVPPSNPERTCVELRGTFC